METILIFCELVAIALLLSGYRRVIKRGEGETGTWLFSYKANKQQAELLVKPKRN